MTDTVFLNLPSVSVMQSARDDILVSLSFMYMADRADHILGIPGYAIVKDNAALTCMLACLEHLLNMWLSNRGCHCLRDCVLFDFAFAGETLRCKIHFGAQVISVSLCINHFICVLKRS